MEFLSLHEDFYTRDDEVVNILKSISFIPRWAYKQNLSDIEIFDDKYMPPSHILSWENNDLVDIIGMNNFNYFPPTTMRTATWHNFFSRLGMSVSKMIILRTIIILKT